MPTGVRSTRRGRDACPLPAGVDPVAVASVPNTLSDASDSTLSGSAANLRLLHTLPFHDQTTDSIDHEHKW
jgi:hypothetical protein